MSNEAGGNPNEANSSGTEAESLAENMVGLSDDYEGLIKGCKGAAGEEEVEDGFRKHIASGILDKISEIEERGLRLAENMQAGARELAETDYENTTGYEVGDMPGLTRPVNKPDNVELT
ncbi:hypothetical protein O4J56_20685 [Nocardiopsis sp. RSe5-2]|uniref:Uncharacterized protein n=1 Tax=Nocardiopsis endophytica TaxID=3018445 RepID=A0ABT4U7Z4_9ACTN|nr:hypothetical protein [Nocardiopsis endophytica]MDA2813075.1 hypothetical protein [Nocardiopsis endophytica]